MKKARLTSIAAALGTTLAVSLSASPMANAAGNPFSMNELSSGYMVAEAEGTCGAMEDTASKEGDSASKGTTADTSAEGKCGEGKCGEKRKAHEGKCGSDKKE
jgi:uncharacterized low-complexity protein